MRRERLSGSRWRTETAAAIQREWSTVSRAESERKEWALGHRRSIEIAELEEAEPMATESSEGEDDVKLTGGNQVLVVEDDLREMGKKAAWSVSSCKPGNGVSALRDDNLETYWQLTLQSISVVLHLFCLVLMLITSLVADLMAFNLIW